MFVMYAYNQNKVLCITTGCFFFHKYHTSPRRPDVIARLVACTLRRSSRLLHFFHEDMVITKSTGYQPMGDLQRNSVARISDHPEITLTVDRGR